MVSDSKYTPETSPRIKGSEKIDQSIRCENYSAVEQIDKISENKISMLSSKNTHNTKSKSALKPFINLTNKELMVRNSVDSGKNEIIESNIIADKKASTTRNFHKPQNQFPNKSIENDLSLNYDSLIEKTLCSFDGE